MQKEFEKMRAQVMGLAGKYSDAKKRRELEQAFALLAKEFEQKQVQSQRVMVLVRGIISVQPGSAKAINEFLRNQDVARAMHSGGNFSL